MIKLFPSQYFFDEETEEKYIKWIFKKTRIFVVAVGILVSIIIAAITIANVYMTGFEVVSKTVLCARIVMWAICMATIISFIWLPAKEAQRVLFATTIVLTFMAFLDTYLWVKEVGYFTPEAQIITIYLFMIIPFLNVEHKVVSGLFIIIGLALCKYFHGPDVFWSMFYVILMYVTNIFVYYKFDMLLRIQFKTICQEKERSNTDLLTGTYNKNALYSIFKKDINSLQPTENMIIGILDLDCFKDYNDNYGHVAGDKVLQQIAQALLSFGFDKVYRFGGEEFVFTVKRDAKRSHKLPDICGVLENLNIPHEYSKVSKYVTASLGVVTIHKSEKRNGKAHEKDINRILTQADDNLYHAKTTGRNKEVTTIETIEI